MGKGQAKERLLIEIAFFSCLFSLTEKLERKRMLKGCLYSVPMASSSRLPAQSHCFQCVKQLTFLQPLSSIFLLCRRGKKNRLGTGEHIIDCNSDYMTEGYCRVVNDHKEAVKLFFQHYCYFGQLQRLNDQGLPAFYYDCKGGGV